MVMFILLGHSRCNNLLISHTDGPGQSTIIFHNKLRKAALISLSMYFISLLRVYARVLVAMHCNRH